MIEIDPWPVNAKSPVPSGEYGNLTLSQSWLTLVMSMNTEPTMAEDKTAEEKPEDVEIAVEAEVLETEAEPLAGQAGGLGDLDGDDFDLDYDVDLSAAGRDALRGAAEGFKRAVSSGIRTVLAADETLRETLPREIPGYVQRQLEATRKEVVVAIAEQTRTFLENIDLGGEVKRHLQEGRLEITTSIRFVADEPTQSEESTSAEEAQGSESETEEEESA